MLGITAVKASYAGWEQVRSVVHNCVCFGSVARGDMQPQRR
jgi:hypothetical protein